MRLLSLLLWTLMVILKRGISFLIEAIECRVFQRTEQVQSKLGSRVVDGATLLPSLSDELVFSQIWPRFHQIVNISLLWRLRQVSRAWREGVGTTLEWVALDMVRVDTPGYVRYLVEHHEHLPPLRDRVKSELESIKLLFA